MRLRAYCLSPVIMLHACTKHACTHTGSLPSLVVFVRWDVLEANCHNKCDSRKRLMLEKPRQVFPYKPGGAERATVRDRPGYITRKMSGREHKAKGV